MPYEIDETHDPKLESWVESANDPGTDFPIQNLPLCWFARSKENECRPGIRIGDYVLDLRMLSKRRVFSELSEKEDEANDADYLESMIAELGGNAESGTPRFRPDPIYNIRQLAYRRRLFSKLLRVENASRAKEAETHLALYEASSLAFMPACGGPLDYTDFYASVFHATNVGSMFRPGNALLPNYKHIPIAYHGRASTIVPSGTDIVRPVGQQAPAEESGTPSYGPCKLLDYELEVGVVVGRGNELGKTIPISEAEDHILGLCLVNDWSARDLQKWEYQPLGPFLAKNFATTVSPYIVTMEALAPFRTPAYERPSGDPSPLPYLTSDHDRAHGGVDLTLEVHLASEQMRAKGMSPVHLSKGSFKDMYWTIAQMLTHHASNGCAMQPGDLLASGTVSGKTRDSRGCLLELTWDGDAFSDPPKLVPGTQRTPITLPTGEERRFLADGDEVILKGYCERDGYRRIGFGECRGVVRPSPNG